MTNNEMVEISNRTSEGWEKLCKVEYEIVTRGGNSTITGTSHA